MIKVNQLYEIGTGWKDILAQVGVDHVDVLRQAQLPEDLLNRDNVRLSTEALLRFSEAIEANVSGPSFWVQLTDAINPEYFSPPIFAALCSPNLATAATRLALFKPLIAPFSLEVSDDPTEFTLTYNWRDGLFKPRPFMYIVEAMFIVKLARLGTRQRIQPTSVLIPELPSDARAFEDFLGMRMQQGEHLQVTFSVSDAHRPFLTVNSAMWSIFEPELRKQLADLEGDATFAERTRAVLLEGLPSGQFTVDVVARRLSVSPRTLQRRLHHEDTSFKKVVDTTREGLARHYLNKTRLTSTEIAYLLGFEEYTSFFRAFQRWTGTTPDTLRQGIRK